MSTNTRVIVVRSEGGRYLDAVLMASNFDEKMESVIGRLDCEWDVVGCDAKISWIDYILAGLKTAGYEVRLCEYADVKV